VDYRVVSMAPHGLYGSSERLTSQKAVSLFLSMTEHCFPEQVDKSPVSELRLRVFVDLPQAEEQMFFVGDADGWKIILAPVVNDAPLPSEN
jgi:hypothetical protein